MTPTTEAALQLQGITKRYPGTVAVQLDDEEILRFEYGTVHALAGQNGAGKSTMVSLIAGMQRPTRGEMRLAGKPYSPSDVLEARERGVDIVLQEPLIVEHMTVEENLLLGRENQFAPHGLFRPAARRRLAAAALDVLPRPMQLKARAGSLPLEEQKLVEMARALSLHPQVLIVDEMSAALSHRGAADLRATLREFTQRGGLVIYISHHLDEVVDFCDRVTILRDGRVVATLDTDATTKDEIGTLMVGAAVGKPRVRKEDPGEEVLVVDSLTVPGRCEEVSFSVRARQVVGIGGLMDCGADAVALSIFGALRHTGGTFRLDGRTVNFNSPAEAVAAGLAYVPADRERDGLLLTQRIDRNIEVAALPWMGSAGFLNPRRSESVANRFIRKLAIRCRGSRDQPIKLSGGNRQKVVLAKWLVRDKRLLMLHNPTRGVDVHGRAEIHSLVNELADQGLAVVLISDDLQELIAMSDHILMMRRGRVSGRLTSADRPTEAQLIGLML
jgi:ribose transport system ATP-binding protein